MPKINIHIRVLEVLKNSKEPLTPEQVAIKLGVGKETARNALYDLYWEDRVNRGCASNPSYTIKEGHVSEVEKIINDWVRDAHHQDAIYE